MEKKQENTKMEKLISLCKRRGFIFQSAEVYGGLQGFWDYGPLGVELKNNIKKAWWKKFVQERDDVVGLDSSIITNSTVWEKSGHLGKFGDLKAECKECHSRYKVEDLPVNIKLLEKLHELMSQELATKAIQKEVEKTLVKVGEDLNKSIKCEKCKKMNWTKPEYFHLMFRTFAGPVQNTTDMVYLRPETAQNIFVQFDNIRQSMRKKVPFGIAQIGKAFRNEITPGNFIFRSREFEQMELEFFVNLKDDKKYFKEFVDASYQFFIDLGIKKENIRKYEQKGKELAHYSKETIDLEYNFPFDKGFAELMGIANRTDYDLNAHGIKYKDDVSKEEFVPHVIEPSAGVDRAMLAFMLDAYEEIDGGRSTTTKSNKEKEMVLRLHKDLAPYKVAILPLSKKKEVSGPTKDLYKELQKHWMVAYDDASSIGRRYRRQDEIGTPYCVTYDFDSNDDKKVTVRDRDTMEQERISIDELVDYLKDKLDS